MTKKTALIEIGTDIIAISRFRKSVERHEKNFLDKIFTKQEQEYCKKYSDPMPRLAARFSAKEAVAKALGCGFNKDLGFLDIEIINNELGKPTITLSHKAIKAFNNPSIKISLSHCKEYATATAIATY